MERNDGRAPDQMRPVRLTPDFLPTAEGSVLIEVGQTRVVVTASVEDSVPMFLRGSGRGDQLVVVNVDIPSHLSSEQRQLFEQLAKTMGSEVRPQERSFFDWLKETLGG